MKSQPIKDIALLGILLAVMEACKRALEFIPNAELVTLLFIIYAYIFGKKAYIVAVCFTLMETFVWGIHTWVIMYLYIWPLLVTIVIVSKKLFKEGAGRMYFSFLAAFFGLFFGMLCSIPYFFIGGLNMQIAWWIAGIPFDLAHCFFNFIITLVLFDPLMYVFAKAYRIYKS